MKRKNRTVLIVLCIITLSLIYVVHWAFFDIQRIHGQRELIKSASPDNAYTVVAFLNQGNATVGCAVLATVINNTNGNSRNIYWQYHCEQAKITWLDNKTVFINGVKLNITKDTYDFRNDSDLNLNN